MKLVPEMWVALLLLTIVPLSATANPDEESAQLAAKSWLGLVDVGAYDPSWVTASAVLKKAVNQRGWVSMMLRGREPYGPRVSLHMRQIKTTHNLPGAPDGNYVVIEYDSRFIKKPGAVEKITLVKEPDAVWRVADYNLNN